jgi:hypoxanthine-guanine phosphoribosyltransferase
MPRGWNEADPEKGQPNRHTRAKIRLMMQDILDDPLALRAVIDKIAEKRPEDVLDAVLWVTEDNEVKEKEKA